MEIDVSELAGLALDLSSAPTKAIRLGVVLTAKTAHDIERAAKIAAPVDTGNLRSSISSTIRGLSAEIGPTANYALFVEEGTSRHGPQPFMRPAADANASVYAAGWAQIMDAVL